MAVPGLLRGNTIAQLDRDARLALLDVPALVSEGALSVHFTYSKQIRHLDKIKTWSLAASRR